MAAEQPSRRLTRAEAKAQTRRRLLDSAALVFANKGFSGASVEEIAESAGYSTGALYANFDSKDQLFMELVADRRAATTSRREEALAGALSSHSGADPLGALSELFVRLAERERQWAPLQAEFWLYALRRPEAMGVIAASLNDQVEALEPVVIEALEREGAASKVAAPELTVVLLALFQGLMRRRRIDPASVADDLLGRALGWLFAGLRAEGAADTDAAPDETPPPAAG